MRQFWDSEKIFFNGDDYFQELINDIRAASNYITIEMYIFNDDLLGRKVVLELINASARGVRVEIIVDGIGSITFFEFLNVNLKKNGIAIKVYNPLPFYHPFYGNLTFGNKIKILMVRIYRINKRNHRKIITIDHSIMYAGSFNITAEHTSHHLMTAWKDIGARVTGNYVKFGVLNFKKNWKHREYLKYKKKLKNSFSFNWRKSPLRLNQNLIMKRYFYQDLLKKIKKSKERIWIMTPYFIPTRKLIIVLGNAASRGVDVKLLISEKTDIHIFYWLQYFYFSYLLKKGVKIFLYTETVLHAKNFIVDNYITIGSTNLNHRSFLHDLEFDLIVQDIENKEQIEKDFHLSTISQISITLEDLKRRPLKDRILSRIFFLFKYWL